MVGFVSEEPYEFKSWFKQILEKRIKNFGVFQSFGDILLPEDLRPSSVLVQPATAAAIDSWPRILSLVEGKVAIPVDVVKDRVTLQSGSSP